MHHYEVVRNISTYSADHRTGVLSGRDKLRAKKGEATEVIN